MSRGVPDVPPSRDAVAASRLRVAGLSKRFGSTQALHDVDLAIGAGEVHALLGANGAGKSTLIRIVAGAIAPDNGEILLDEQPITLASPADARELGIAVIHQQLSVIPSLTVAENFMIKRTGRARPRALFPSRKKPGAVASATLRQFDQLIDPHVRLETLTFSQRQLVEIAIAVSSNVRVLIMDEPTSGLSAHEQQALFAAIRGLVQSGVSVVYVSHKMNEVYQLADRITVLREGRNVAEFTRASLDPDAVVEAILGRRLLAAERETSDPVARRRRAESSHRSGSLVVEELRTEGVSGVSFEVARGEILGLFGAVGSGVSKVAEALFGARPSSGSIRLDRRELELGSTVRARRQGVAFVPADHRERGLVSLMSIRENVLMGRGRWRRDFIRRVGPALRADVQRSIDSVGVKCRDQAQLVSELSGGNQQKVVFARWILEQPDVLVLEDPTQGIDVGAKVDMFNEIRRQRDRGAAVVFISSEVSEIVSIADRALVMRDGAVVGKLEGDELEERRILGLAAGS